SAVPEGALVLADAAWRDVAVLDARHERVLPELPGIPPSYHLGVLGMPGLTAWAGLFRLAAFQAGDAVFVSGAAGAVGRVIDSRSSAVPEGSLVLADAAWRDVAVLDASHVRVLPELPGIPPSYHLGVLGMPGLTAWAGLFRLAAFQEGDAVFVSGAAGAVGSLVGQFARLNGASSVIGSAGTPEKVRWLTEEVGFTAAFDYHDGPVGEQLAVAAPGGIDVFFDNVGGEHLEAAIGALNEHGRAALCGAISGYNAVEPLPGPRNMFMLVTKKLSLRGFIVGDHADLRDEFIAKVTQLVTSGELVVRETVREGLENAVPAFLDLLRGGNTGKMVVRLTAE
ncbi:MAG: hypothetical protein JWR82_605, partial [Blastococcus sp.]|nr:hypothetical protein [Blastococcus sp.]